MTSGDYTGYRTWKGWEHASFGSFDAVSAAYFASEISRSGLSNLNGKQVLEIGFGNGAFAGWAISRGIVWSGVEVQSELLDLGRAKELSVFTSFDEAYKYFGTGVMDQVVAFDVLEHLTLNELIELLKAVYCLLKSGGVLLARVPSGDSPFGRAIFHGDITHRIALGSSAIHQLAVQTGFEVIDIGPPRFPIFGVGWIRAIRRSGIKLVQMLSSRFINLIFHDGQPRVITQNLVFVLKKPVAGR